MRQISWAISGNSMIDASKGWLYDCLDTTNKCIFLNIAHTSLNIP